MKISVFYAHILEASEQTKLSLQDILKQARAWGISEVDIANYEIKGSNAEMKALLNEQGFSVASLYGFFEFGKGQKLEEGFSFIDTAVELGASKVLIIPGFVELEQERQVVLEKMVSALEAICEYAAKRNIRVTLEDFDDEKAPFSKIEELTWFLEKVPALGLTFDTGNFKFQEQDELEAFSKLKEKIVHVHCKDRALVGRKEEVPKLTVAGNKLFPSPVGYGCIQMKEILELLKHIEYQGTLAIEHFGHPHQLECMRQSVNWIVNQGVSLD